MRRIAIENFGNLAEAFVLEVTPQFRQPLLRLLSRLGRSPIHLEISSDERPYQPWPNRTLMVGTVAAQRVSFETAVILRVAGRQAA